MEWKRGEGGVGRVTLTCLLDTGMYSLCLYMDLFRVAIPLTAGPTLGMLEGGGVEYYFSFFGKV